MRRSFLLVVSFLLATTLFAKAFIPLVIPELLATAIESLAVRNITKKVLFVGSSIAFGWAVGKLWQWFHDRGKVIPVSPSSSSFQYSDVSGWELSHSSGVGKNDYWGNRHEANVEIGNGQYTYPDCFVTGLTDSFVDVVCPENTYHSDISDRTVYRYRRIYFDSSDVDVVRPDGSDDIYIFPKNWIDEVVGTDETLPVPDIVVSPDSIPDEWQDAETVVNENVETTEDSGVPLSDIVPLSDTASDTTDDGNQTVSEDVETAVPSASDIAQAIDDQISQSVSAVSVPDIPAVPNFDPSLDMPQPPSILEKIQGIVNFLNLRNRISLNLSSSTCDVPVRVDIFGNTVSSHIDFCRFQSSLQRMGDVLVGVVSVLSVFLMLGV